MRRILLITLATSLAIGAPLSGSESVSLLRGSRGAMTAQNRVARDHGLSFYLTPDQVRKAVARGELVPLTGNADYDVARTVSHPYAIPAVSTFVERLAAEYRAGCGQKLVVTSATRAVSQQPRNAHALSVHPAGMAIDVRVSDQPLCRHRLEGIIIELNRRGVANGIREYNPPHYHIAIYPGPYLAYVEEQLARERAESGNEVEEAGVEAPVDEALAPDWYAAALAAAEDAVAPPEYATEPMREAPSRARALLSLSVTMLAGMVGGGLVLGVRVPAPGMWTPRVRRSLAEWTPRAREWVRGLSGRRASA